MRRQIPIVKRYFTAEQKREMNRERNEALDRSFRSRERRKEIGRGLREIVPKWYSAGGKVTAKQYRVRRWKPYRPVKAGPLTPRENKLLGQIRKPSAESPPPRKLTSAQVAAMLKAPPTKGSRAMLDDEKARERAVAYEKMRTGGKVSHHKSCKHKSNSLVMTGNIFSRYK